MIMKNFKFKPIFPLATNAKIVDVETFDLSPHIVAFVLKPLTTTSTLEPFVATSSSKPLFTTFVSNPFIVAFALEPTLELVIKIQSYFNDKK